MKIMCNITEGNLCIEIKDEIMTRKLTFLSQTFMGSEDILADLYIFKSLF